MGKRGPAGAIDRHPQRAEIELAIANDIAVGLIANHYGLHRNTVGAYKSKMSPERKVLLKYRTGDSPLDLEELKRSEAQATVTRAVAKMADLEQLYQMAIKIGDFNTAIRATGEYRKYLDLQARLVGELVTGDRHLHLQVSESPAYKKLVALVMGWASDKPDLAADLAAFLEAAERPLPMLDVTPKGSDGAGA